MKIFKIKNCLLIGLLITGLVSCKKQFDVQPGVELDASQMYRDVYDANAAVMGIYGRFMSLADRYIILNELRGDLMQYTQNADQYLRQLSTHSVTPDNPYINPRPFYELILHCNDALKNFDIMLQKKTLSQDEYNQRYSDIACLRSFLYLQLGIHYGEVPYVTEPIETITDASDLSRFNKLALPALIDTLARFTDNLPYKNDYPAPVGAAIGASLNITLDAYPTNKFFINKKALLGDLFLWKGDYNKAATYYREVMEVATTGTMGENYYSQYKLAWSGNANLYVSYARAGDVNSILFEDGWGAMFHASDDRFNREMIWALPYDNKFKPENPLIKLFSPTGGNYLVKPSQQIVDNWNSQTQGPMRVSSSLTVGTAGIPFDSRKLLSVREIGGQPVITKFIANYLNPLSLIPTNPLTKNGRWFLFRQAHLHLRYAEAANRQGYPRLAYALFNNGIQSNYPAPSADVTNFEGTWGLPAPYVFDAREGEIPRYRGDWYRNIGIRGRAGVLNYPLTATTVADSTSQIEIGLLEEAALETAFEGNRWPDLLRIAMRRNDPSLIADRVFAKLTKDGVGNAGEARAKLLRREWFLPFKFE